MPTLRVYRGREHRLDFLIDRSEIVVGRGVEADLQLDSEAVSRRHLSIRKVGPTSYAAEDLGGKNGLFINGQFTNFKLLEDGDRIEIAQHMIVFLAAELDSAERSVRDRPSLNLRSKALQGVGDAEPHGDGPRRFGPQGNFVQASTAFLPVEKLEAMREQLTLRRGAHIAFLHEGKRVEFALTEPAHYIGWSARCSIKLPDDKLLFRTAAVVEAMENGHRVRSLSFWRPLRVGEEHHKEYALDDDEVFEVAGFRLRYRAAVDS